jgi:hypothetical protein
MLRIIRSRGYGKTYDLIKYALENDVAIIVGYQSKKRHHLEMGKRCFGKEPKVYTIEEWNKEDCHRVNEDYVVDELEMVVRIFLKGHMVGYSMSME